MSYKVGDKVHVEFDAVVADDGTAAGDRMWTYKLREDTPEGSGLVHYVYLHEHNATVTETEPVSWPPQIGDVWEADGNDYFVYDGVFGVTIFPARGTFNTSLKFYDVSGDGVGNFKALRPRLVRRREGTASGEAVYNFLRSSGGHIG